MLCPSWVGGGGVRAERKFYEINKLFTRNTFNLGTQLSDSNMTKLTNTNAARMNPCLKEQEQSYECLNKNGFDHAKCEAYFDNYNTCKKFWGKVYSDRKAKGIHPFLPDVEERDKIKSDYMKRVRATLEN